MQNKTHLLTKNRGHVCYCYELENQPADVDIDAQSFMVPFTNLNEMLELLTPEKGKELAVDRKAKRVWIDGVNVLSESEDGQIRTESLILEEGGYTELTQAQMN